MNFKKMSKEEQQVALKSTEVSQCSALEHKFYQFVGTPDYLLTTDDERQPNRQPLSNKTIIENGYEKLAAEDVKRQRERRFPSKTVAMHFVPVTREVSNSFTLSDGKSYVNVKVDVPSTVSGNTIKGASVMILEEDAKPGNFILIKRAVDVDEEYIVFDANRQAWEHTIKANAVSVQAQTVLSREDMIKACRNESVDMEAMQADIEADKEL